MVKISFIDIPGYEKVVEGIDEASGLHCFIALHNTSLGPALGGTRIYPYAKKEEAIEDVLRLSKGMTYKSAIAKVGTGGGKAVIMADSHTQKTPKLLQTYAEVVNSLNGEFITAEDVGVTTDDVAIMREVTPHLVGLPLELGSGDPSPFTAWGVFKGIEAVAHTLWGSDSLLGKRVAIQGLGKVGSLIADYLFWHGATLIVSDINKVKTEKFAKLYSAEVADTNEIHKVECDIFCPCALGGIINDKTINELKCQAVAGSANNQLQDDKHGDMLQERGILYAPDFIINSGGLINVTHEIAVDGYKANLSRDGVNHLYDILIYLFERARSEEKSTEEVAVEIADYNLEHGIGKRKNPVVYAKPNA